MKLIEAIIEPVRLDAVTDALSEAEIFRLTISEVEGAGHDKTSTEIAGSEVQLDFVPMMRLEIAVNDDFLDPAVKAIRKGLGDGKGVGKIMVFELEDVIRVRTGERGPEAI